MSVNKNIIIIGGGASGLFAAIKAKENNPQKDVAILEAQSRVGRKLLSSGNGRCNLTNTSCSKKYYHGSFRKFIDIVLGNCSVDRVIKEFMKLGLMTKVEDEGRVYPVSNHAGSVLDVLRFRLDALGVETICDTRVNDIHRQKKGFYITTNNVDYICDKLIVCAGSCASPKLGSDSSVIKILKELGHNVTPLSPALCPIKVKSELLSSLKGVRVEGKVSLLEGENIIKEEYGEIQFADNSLSGICVFNLSSEMKKARKPCIAIDLLPYSDKKYIINILLKHKEIYNNINIENLFTGVFVKKLGMVILKQAQVLPFSRKISSITDDEIERIADVIKDWRFEAQKSNDFSHAQAVSGGIAGSEINPYSMESSIINNLYICGEAIDIDGDCGGFNLQFAFASGIIAGENV
ncbi:MAG: aminoacetone oxidase family FAD-binding enzyme [Ruminococcus sp.]|nr:aminoacetone oxidase family FAD-binding enzyme [Ruminococcus sp.]